ncbi:uncharacterized protein LOC142620423 [Castanea sativa]|uniref:uncharacterized protein LOC142620423 n=1 Tax=Castanea sativa TaxID=21020 RepID=UPI003F64F728
MCLALFFAVDKLEHYMQAHTVRLIAKVDPVKYVLSRPVVSGRIARWAVLLQQYDLTYVPQKAIKGQVLADFLADHPVPSDWEFSDDFQTRMSEYQALIIGLQMAIEIGISHLEVFGDSKLIINQTLEQYDVKKEDLVPYCKYAKKLLTNFEAITLEHILRKENGRADALANWLPP